MIVLVIVGIIVVGAGFWLVGAGRKDRDMTLYLCGLLVCFAGGGLIGSAVTYLMGWV